MVLETERLVLTTWQPSDWLAFRPIATDVEVMRYITGGEPWTEERIQAFVNRQIQLYSERGFCRWKLLLKPSMELIGFCGVGFWGKALEPEIGWWLARQHWGCGFATEAARVALQDGFERVGLERINSIARPANAASIHIMEKLGFQRDCEFLEDDILVVRHFLNRSRS